MRLVLALSLCVFLFVFVQGLPPRHDTKDVKFTDQSGARPVPGPSQGKRNFKNKLLILEDEPEFMNKVKREVDEEQENMSVVEESEIKPDSLFLPEEHEQEISAPQEQENHVSQEQENQVSQENLEFHDQDDNMSQENHVSQEEEKMTELLEILEDIDSKFKGTGEGIIPETKYEGMEIDGYDNNFSGPMQFQNEPDNSILDRVTGIAEKIRNRVSNLYNNLGNIGNMGLFNLGN